MNSKQTFFVLLAVNCLLLAGVFGAVYSVDKLLSAQSHKLVGQRLQIQTLDAEATALGKAKKEVTQYSSLSDIAATIVPQDKNQAQTVREIVNIAGQNGIKLGSITFPSSTLGTVGTGALSLSQLEPVKGIPGVYSLEIVVQSDDNNPVPYAKFLNFLSALEHNRRTALVSNIALTPDAKTPGAIGFNLSLDEYIKP